MIRCCTLNELENDPYCIERCVATHPTVWVAYHVR